MKPTVTLLHHTPIGVAEIAARTCYDSFDKGSELMQGFGKSREDMADGLSPIARNAVNSKDTELLEKLVWAHHHESIVEHINLSFFIQGLSRGVLQQHARHRIQSISVQSTRYTMTELAAAMGVLKYFDLLPEQYLLRMVTEIMDAYDIVVSDSCDAEASYFASKALPILHNKVASDLLSKEQLSYLKDMDIDASELTNNFTVLLNLVVMLSKMKSKRNVGDDFKVGVTDTWVTSMVVTMNVRALKNFIKLRNAGSAYDLMEVFAQELEKVIPKSILKLIKKGV